ncbi:hypothetical protein FACS1894145_3620 [Bacteroidia bacterium]|nr:hypothetical protein FACS1894145_3620 [Bacteroidia bacterium]
MKNIIAKLSLTAIAAIVCCLTSCVKEPLHDTDHPEHGKIISLATTWDDRGEGIDIPASYTIKIGDYSAECRDGASPVSIDHLFPAGQYTIHIYNVSDNISVNGTTATANYAAGELGWLFTGSETVTIEKDKDHHVSVAMRQQVRQLTLIFDVTGDARDRLSGVEATLSGAAGAINIENGNPVGEAVTVIPVFAQTEGRYAATIRLLGITGTGQTLSLTLHFAGGNPRSFTLTSDLSDALAAFNADRKTPLTLTSGITVSITPLGVTAEISDWEGSGNETVIAE